MTRIVFSEAGRNDRRAVTAYTVEQFGLRQARRLRANFERALNTLAVCGGPYWATTPPSTGRITPFR